MLHRVCIENATGKLIAGHQSGGDTHSDPKIDDDEYAAINLEVVRQNTINIGWVEGDITAKWVNDEELAVLLAEMVESELTYIDRRKTAYPDPMILNDAKVKQQSSDPAIVAEGQAQEMQYYSDCLQVKEDYPKTA